MKLCHLTAAAAPAALAAAAGAVTVPVGDLDALTPTAVYTELGPIFDVSAGTAGNAPGNYVNYFPLGFEEDTPILPSASQADFTVRLTADLAPDLTLEDGTPGVVPLFEAGGAGSGFSIFYNLRSGALGLFTSIGANIGPVVVPDGTTDVVGTISLDEDFVSLFANGELVGTAAFTSGVNSGGNGPSIGDADGAGNIVFATGIGGFTDAPDGFIDVDAGVEYYFDVAVVENPDRLAGDANGDGSVTIADFAILRANFGTSDSSFSMGDFNEDGSVTIADFAILRANFGSSVSSAELAEADAWAASVPEPAALGLLAAAGLGLVRRR